jgi:hypothetical protein
MGTGDDHHRVCRVSTQDQDLSAQLDALRKAGAKTVYREKISGVRADRPQLKKLMASLRKGDIGAFAACVGRFAPGSRFSTLNLV